MSSSARRGRALLALVTALGAAACEPRAAPPVERAALRARLEELRAGAAGVEVAGVAVAHLDAAGRLRSAAVGCARFGVDGRTCVRPLVAETVLRVASMSKLVTALVVLRLVQAGRLALDADVGALLAGGDAPPARAPLRALLRNPAFPAARITVRQLLSHTSSLRDGEVYSLPPPATLAVLLAQPDRFSPRYSPGAYFHYANINYVVLGAVVEVVAGERFDRAAARLLLAPAGVLGGYGWASAGAAAVALSGTPVRRRDAAERWLPGGPWLAQVDDPPVAVELPPDYVLGTCPQALSPHGGLRISAVELARLVRAALAGRAGAPPLLDPDSRRRLVAPVVDDPDQRGGQATVPGDLEGGMWRGYALGNHAWALGGRRLRAHLGDAYGLKGAVVFDPTTSEVWVFLVTGYGAPPPPDADPGLPGLDAVEAEVARALWSADRSP